MVEVRDLTRPGRNGTGAGKCATTAGPGENSVGVALLEGNREARRCFPVLGLLCLINCAAFLAY